MENLHKMLFDKGLLNDRAFHQLDAILSKKIISLHFELRLSLYLGILLFTGGLGFVVYENIGSLGHILMMLILTASIGFGFYIIDKKSLPYSSSQVDTGLIYFDYLLLLIGLLSITLFTYIQVYFDLVEILIRWTSLATGGLFMFLAYRYDNKMLLSLGIVALAAVLGLTLTPVNWSSGDWFSGTELYLLSTFYGIFLLIISQVLNKRQIKSHFTFTYQHFGWLLFYFGALAIVFDSDYEVLLGLLSLVLLVPLTIFHWRQKSFLFFIYSSACVYTMVVFLLVLAELSFDLYLFFFPLSALGFILFLIFNRTHFSENE